MALLTQSAAAKHCKVGRNTFIRWCKDPKVKPPVPYWIDPTSGTRWYVSTQLDKWMDNLDERQAS